VSLKSAPKTAAPERSFIHRLDPRVKLVIALAFTFLVFLVDSLPVAAAQAFFFAGLARASKTPLREIYPSRRLLIPAIALTVVMQALFRRAPNETILFAPLIPAWAPLLGGAGAITLEGVVFGLVISCRILALSAIMPLLALTTEARQLAFAVTKLGAGYKAAHVITATLNLAGSFKGELAQIIDARRLSGAKPRGFFARLAGYRAIALPLALKAMRRSVQVALVMDARAFGSRKKRTWLIEARMTGADAAAFAAAAFYAAAILLANNFKILLGA